MNVYEKIVKKQRREIAKLTVEQQKQILDLYDGAIKDLAGKVEMAKEKSLEERWQLDYLKELDRARNELEKEVRRQVESSTKKAAGIGTKAEQEVMGEVFRKVGIDVGPHFSGMFSQVQDNVVRDIITGDLYKDKRTLSQRIWNYGEDFEKDIQYTINQAILQKKSAIELAEDLERFVREPAKRGTTWGRCYPRLMNKRVDYNAMRLARTSINHAYQTASIQASNLNPFVEGIKWRSALIHGRTCELCRERDGQIFSKDDVPLDHPNGLCIMLPVIEKSIEQVAEELRNWLDGGEDLDLDSWYNKYGEIFGKVIKGKEKAVEVRIKEKPKEKTYKSTKEAFKRVTYTNIDKEYVKEIDEELLDIINKYPLDSKGMTVKTLKKDRYFGCKGYGITNDKKTGKLKLVDDLIYSSVYHKDKEISSRMHIMNYKNRGSLLADSEKAHLATISHEYGHAIDTYYLLEKDKRLVEDIKKINGVKLDWGTIDLANSINSRLAGSEEKLSHVLWDRMKKEYGMEGKEFHEKVYDELGSYAASSAEEFLAEGFANMSCLEEGQKTEFIKMFEKMFNEEFDKVLRGGW